MKGYLKHKPTHFVRGHLLLLTTQTNQGKEMEIIGSYRESKTRSERLADRVKESER